MKPDFVLIGAAKCATTAISNLLSQHPEIFMISKETHFFSRDEVYAQGIEWYESLYQAAGDRQIRGERNNCYAMKEVYPETVARMADYNPDLKLIYCVRHPIERIESYWIQKRSHGGEDVHFDFNTAVRVNQDWLVDGSNYWQQLNAFRQRFSDDQILILFYEDFKADPSAVMRHCFSFLGVDPDIPLNRPEHRVNPTSEKQVPKKSLSKLRAFPLYRLVSQLIPASVRTSFRKKFFFEKVQGRPEWHPDTRNWAIEVLESDTQQFLQYCGKPADFWQLRPISSVVPALSQVS